MRAILWCQTISYAWNLSPKIMDCFNNVCNLPSSFVHLHHLYFEGFRPRRKYCGSCRKYFSMANSCNVLFYSIFYLPNVPSSTEQEHDYCIPGSFFSFDSHPPFMATHCQIQVWNPRSYGIYDFGLLDSKYWTACFCYLWRLS